MIEFKKRKELELLIRLGEFFKKTVRKRLTEVSRGRFYRISIRPDVATLRRSYRGRHLNLRILDSGKRDSKGKIPAIYQASLVGDPANNKQGDLYASTGYQIKRGNRGNELIMGYGRPYGNPRVDYATHLEERAERRNVSIFIPENKERINAMIYGSLGKMIAWRNK